MLSLLHFFLLLFLKLSSFLLQCNNNEIRPGKHIGVCISVANNRLFVGSIPKSKTKEQIVEEFAKVTGESPTSFCSLTTYNILCNVYSTASFLHFTFFAHQTILNRFALHLRFVMRESVGEASTINRFPVCVQMMTSLLCWSDSRYYDGLPLRSDWTLNVVNSVFDTCTM